MTPSTVAIVACFPTCVSICVALAIFRQLQRRIFPVARASAASPRRVALLIPAYNAAHTIERAIASGLEDPLTSLVVVVACDSNDDTANVASRLARAPSHAETKVVVVEAAPWLRGRANCLNLAARVAAEHLEDDDDDTALVFLHADTALPPSYGQLVIDALADGRAACGAFCIYTVGARDAPSLLGRLVGLAANAANNARSVWMEAPYGDQALFCRRSAFLRVGGFPSVPLMEDSAFVWAARALGEVRIVRGPCVRSFASPQWLRTGPLYAMRNYLILTAWLLGLATPRWLHALYYPGRPMPRALPYSDLAAAPTDACLAAPRRHRVRASFDIGSGQHKMLVAVVDVATHRLVRKLHEEQQQVMLRHEPLGPHPSHPSASPFPSSLGLTLPIIPCR